jgi:Tfp pilus assembly protein PilF
MDINNSIHVAFQQYQAGNLQQAKRLCMEILEEQPNNEECLYLLGIVYAGLEEYDLAIQNIERSLQSNIRNADAYLALGAIFQKKGLFDEAINFYRKALEIDPDFAEAYENLGDIFRDKQQLDEAVSCYKKALQYVPNAAEIHCNLGNIFREKGQPDLAMFYYRTALRYKPAYAEAYKNLGTIYHEQRRLDEAISYYEKALQLDPNLAEARIDLEDALNEKMQHRDWSEFTIRIGFMKVQMMINAVINQFYFKTLNIQFHPDVLYDENPASGLKRRILENIFVGIKQIDDIDQFFNDLDRLNTIRKHYADRHLEIRSLQNEKSAIPDYRQADGMTAFERIHNEFMLTAAKIEAQLVRVLNS